MGTNFYIRGNRRDDDPTVHIGKRSAAGLYCWDCRITLCKGGYDAIHGAYANTKWNSACPKCGKTQEKEPMETSAVGRELGFNKEPPTKKTGVRGCASFTWAMPLVDMQKAINELNDCPSCGRPYEDIKKCIEDEYGRIFTEDEFMQMLELECPIQFHDSIGKYFS